MDQLGLVFFAINKENQLIAKNNTFDNSIKSLGFETVEIGNLIFSDQVNQPSIINKFRELIARVYLVDAISEIVYFEDKHINITIIALRDETQISGFAVLLQDLTKEHQLQKNLDISVANLSAIINSTDELILRFLFRFFYYFYSNFF